MTQTAQPARPAQTGERFAAIAAKLSHMPLVLIGGTIVGVPIIMAVFAPFIAPYDPFKINMNGPLLPPSETNFFGTDELGRDIFSRILYGARLSIAEGVFAVAIAMAIGVPYGMIAGYRGGWVDTVLMRIVDVALAFPGVLLAIIIVSILGPSLVNAVIAIGLYAVPVFARVARGATMSTRSQPYVESCQSVGMGSVRIMVRHILPNIASTLWVIGALHIALAILSASSLSFLGLGAQAPSPEWGAMLSNGRNYMLIAPHIVIFPGGAILLLVLGINLVHDGLRTVLDPKMQDSR